MAFKEIVYKNDRTEKVGKTNEKCPKCKSLMRYGIIPCPDKKDGCLALHYGYHCKECNSYFQKE